MGNCFLRGGQALRELNSRLAGLDWEARARRAARMLERLERSVWEKRVNDGRGPACGSPLARRGRHDEHCELAALLREVRE